MSDLILDRKITLDLNEIQPQPWEAPLPTASTEKPRIQIPGKGRQMSTFATELGQSLRQASLFIRETEVIAQRDGTMEFETMTPTKFVTWIEDHVQCHEGQANADGSGTTVRSINTTIASQVLEAVQFRRELPVVKALNPIRQPVLDSAGQLRLLPTGYDGQTQTLTARGNVQYPLAMTLDEARAILTKLLSEFCFADRERGTAVQTAAMVTAYGMGLLSDTCTIPAFVYNANASGAGKGLCVALALAPILGRVPTGSAVRSEQEREKRLFASVRAGERYLLLDNLDTHMASPSLESFLTSPCVTARVLGTSSNETHPKKTAVFITGNLLTMRSDMRRRSLVVDFFLPQVRSENRRIVRPLDEQGILLARSQILGALYALVRSWVEAEKPEPTRHHPSFVEWSRIIGGIVEHAGLGCPIPCLETVPDVDPETADMESLVPILHAQANPFGFTFRQVVDLCRDQGLFEGRLPSTTQERRGNTEFGRLLKRFHDREFPNGMILRIRGTGHARRYAVESVRGTEGARESDLRNVVETPAPHEPSQTPEASAPMPVILPPVSEPDLARTVAA